MEPSKHRDAFQLRCALTGHKNEVYRISLSSDGVFLASPSADRSVRLWDCRSGTDLGLFEGHSGEVLCAAWSTSVRHLAVGGENASYVWDVRSRNQPIEIHNTGGRVSCIAWRPGDELLALGAADGTIALWNNLLKRETSLKRGHASSVTSVAWSPSGTQLCSGSEDSSARIWDIETNQELTLSGHKGPIASVAWCGDQVISASHDRTVSVWESKTGRRQFVLEGHTGRVVFVSPMAAGRLVVSLDEHGDLIVWDSSTWVQATNVRNFCGSNYFANFAAHPTLPILAICGNTRTSINVWAVDFARLLKESSASSTVFYVNAKAVLVGESGVGKSGLGIRIAERLFRHTEGSTHGAQFWHFSKDQLPSLPSGVNAELTLWDLAGQKEYRLTHQLFLDDTDVALLLFDSSDPNDPFRGVPYWAKVLKRHAPPHALKLLVASRSDVSPPTSDPSEIKEVLDRFGLHEYFVTSARTGQGVQSLFDYLITSLPWYALPRTSTPVLFQTIRQLLLDFKSSGRGMISLEQLQELVANLGGEHTPEQVELDTVIQLLQSRGVVFRVDPRPGVSWVLLKPELVNQYGASVLHAARNHPEGIGAVIERDVLTGSFALSGIERLPEAEERLVIEATIELLIRHDICFREMGFLVFPSQFKVMRNQPPNTGSRTEVAYRFSGNIESIFASLVVRLGYTDYFRREAHWRHAVEFSREGHRLGLSVREINEGIAELSIYFDSVVNEFDRLTFIRFVTNHLANRGIEIEEQMRLYCTKCTREVTDHDAIEIRVKSGELDIPCQYCKNSILIPKGIEQRYQRDKSLVDAQAQLTQTVELRTAAEARQFQSDQQQYSGEKYNGIRLLHLSDLHIHNDAAAAIYRTQLETDSIDELGVKRLDYLIISGDIANTATEAEYRAAFKFVDGIVKRFGLDASRVVVVPGNHDVDWESSLKAYVFQYRSKMPLSVASNRIIAAGDIGVLIRDDEAYQQRFANFSTHFYGRIYGGSGYPTDVREQAVIRAHSEDRLLFLGLNSAWDLDHHFRERYSINSESVSRAIDEIHSKQYDGWLKIAIWHHPVSGTQAMNGEFLQLLAVHEFKMCMSGHIHEASEGFYKYDSDRSLHLVGAGAFGAQTKEQVPGIPLQYNLLNFDPEQGLVVVQTRKKEKSNGAWSADARWGDKNAPVPFYSFRVR